MEDVKEILERQLQLLSEVSENLRRSDYPARDLTKLSVAMTGIAGLLLEKAPTGQGEGVETIADEVYQSVHNALESTLNRNS